jgi:hypothetical protein
MTFYADNGILAKIPGDLIARGSKTLPSAGAGEPETSDTPKLRSFSLHRRTARRGGELPFAGWAPMRPGDCSEAAAQDASPRLQRVKSMR